MIFGEGLSDRPHRRRGVSPILVRRDAESRSLLAMEMARLCCGNMTSWSAWWRRRSAAEGRNTDRIHGMSSTWSGGKELQENRYDGETEQYYQCARYYNPVMYYGPSGKNSDCNHGADVEKNAQKENVPWSEVHWTDHSTPQHHTNPNQHFFNYKTEEKRKNPCPGRTS